MLDLLNGIQPLNKYFGIQISSQDKNIKEITNSFGIVIPSIQIFRNGRLMSYKVPDLGPGIVKFLLADSQVIRYQSLLPLLPFPFP